MPLNPSLTPVPMASSGAPLVLGHVADASRRRARLVTTVAVDVGALTLAVEDHDHLCGPVDGHKSVGRHGGELGGLADLDIDLAVAEQQPNSTLEHEEPVMARMDAFVGDAPRRHEAHLHRDRGAGRSAEHPRRAITRLVRRWPDDDVVVAGDVEEDVDADLERGRQWEQDVEAERALAGFDATDRGGAEVRARPEVVERQAEGGAEGTKPGPHDLFDVSGFDHRGSFLLANTASGHAIYAIHRIVDLVTTNHSPRTVERHCDVAIVGGSAAGLAAALQLGRQRRSVIVIDAGEPRNAPAPHMHGYLGREGTPPAELTAIGRNEVRSYGAEVLDGRVVTVTQQDDARFRVELVGGHAIVARRVLAATGLIDELSDIDGVAEQWGHGVVHCPFCHGFEIRDRRIVQIVTHPMGLHPTVLFRQLSEHLTVVLHDDVEVESAALDVLRASGVDIRAGHVTRVATGIHGDVVAVELTDQEPIAADVVAVGPRFRVRAEPFAALGLQPTDHPSGLGDHLDTDATGQTTIPGLYAAGNVTDPSQQVLQAAADGSRIGAMISFSLADEDTQSAGRRSGNEADWDHRYSGDAMWSGHPNGTLVQEVAGLAPGRALDVGAGEGADALWLADQGWHVTASDISQRALDRVDAAARSQGLAVRCHHADANALDPFEAAPFDLVSAQYASIPRTPDWRAVRNLLDAVAPGGTLLIVSHDLEPMRTPIDTTTHSRAFDPDAYIRVDDMAAALSDTPGWQIETHEKRPRPGGSATAAHHVDDVVLRARRMVP